jgi:hypothetical protein
LGIEPLCMLGKHYHWVTLPAPNLRHSLEPRWLYVFYSTLSIEKHGNDIYLQKAGIFILAARLMHSFIILVLC